ncbi:MAG: Coenzyme F420 hydrogenase/dehydrogenase, beta subunit C-terminal domain, partial [Pseudomonadota bacterium]
VHALRAVEDKLGLEKLYVIGTPCSDNTTTENFHLFLAKLVDRPETVTYCEFRPDYRVELRFDDGRTRLIPFLKLPLADLPSDFFPLPCQTCVDYTNALADITVGYMAGEGDQWLIVRNAKGQEILDRLADDVTLEPVGSSGKREAAVRGFLQNTERAAGGLPLRRIPGPLRGFVGLMQRLFGPRGLEFAKARLEMKAIETVLHLRRAAPDKVARMVPQHVWQIVAPYGLRPTSDEAPRAPGSRKERQS